MSTTLPTGVSQAARTLDKVKRSVLREREDTITFSNHSLHDQLIDVYEECSLHRISAKPVTATTLSIAKDFVESLPHAIRTPEITGENDGNVNLEWYVHRRRILSVSVSESGLLYWAALIGEEDPRGTCRFYGEPPNTLLYWIRRVYVNA